VVPVSLKKKDMVLVAMGGAARETEQTRGVPTDAAVVAIVDPSR